jgi:hypothetical protein
MAVYALNAFLLENLEFAAAVGFNFLRWLY